MRQYSGHYKVNGTPVNVLATLDQIIEILPHTPSEFATTSCETKT